MISYCINLSRRIDKWGDVCQEFAKYGITPVRVDAYDTKPGWQGCRDSHLSILKRAKRDSLSQFVVYEDDVIFLQDPNDILPKAVKELPEDWDMLYLGVSPQEPLSLYSEHLFKVNKSTCLHAVMYNNRKDGVIDYILKHRVDIKKIDDFYSSEVHRKFNVFVTYPMICTQRQYQSDTCGRSDVSTIVKNYTKYSQHAV